MSHRSTLFFLALLVVIAALLSNEAEGRYLPTRSAGFDKLDKLKELLREFLESEIDKEDGDSQPRWHPESKLFYKREIPLSKLTKIDNFAQRPGLSTDNDPRSFNQIP